MTVSVLRTADAWWVQTPTGAAKISSAATSTGALLADRAAVDAAASGPAPEPGGIDLDGAENSARLVMSWLDR